jgi:hypothetical protein
MKTNIQCRTKKVNHQKKTNLMKVTMRSKIGVFTLFLLLFGFNACQKDVNVEDNPSYITKKPVSYREIPAGDIIPIEDNARQSPFDASPRAELADIEDVPVVTPGVISNCGGTEDQKILCSLSFRNVNSIKPGQRKGIIDNLNTNGGTSVTSCYNYNNQNVCGYIGKEALHPLFIGQDGNYRLQLTPKNPDRDFDVFVYKLSVLNTVIHRTLVAHSVLPQGQTETLHITEDGVYDIVVDEYPNKNGQVGVGDGNYILSLSPNTLIKTTPTYNKATDNVTYQFSLKSIKVGFQLKCWLFRKKIGNNWVNLGTYAPNDNFLFSCGTCDYLVSPIYESLIANTPPSEGKGTVIRP